SETELVRLCHAYLKLNQSDFVSFESTLSRDHVGFVSVETKSDQSLSRASWHSTLDLEPAQTYELKSGLIHLLPKFHGLAGEDPHKNLKEFHMVCSTMTPVSILPGWSCKRLAVSAVGSFQHLGRHEAYVPGEILSSIQNRNHQEGNMWDKATFWRNST
ncbi:hypothetical protein CR513_41699, partial [Mucuna pruriens]